MKRRSVKSADAWTRYMGRASRQECHARLAGTTAGSLMTLYTRIRYSERPYDGRCGDLHDLHGCDAASSESDFRQVQVRLLVSPNEARQMCGQPRSGRQAQSGVASATSRASAVRATYVGPSAPRSGLTV